MLQGAPEKIAPDGRPEPRIVRFSHTRPEREVFVTRLIAGALAAWLAMPGLALAQQGPGPLQRAADREAARVAPTLTVDRQSAQPARRGGHPILIGALIGGAGMFVLTRAECGWQYGEAACSGAGTMLLTGAGVGIGAAAGAIVGALRKEIDRRHQIAPHAVRFPGRSRFSP
jgi:hypothetical protein